METKRARKNGNAYDNLLAIWTILRMCASEERPMKPGDIAKVLQQQEDFAQLSRQTVGTILTQHRDALEMVFGCQVLEKPSPSTVQKSLRYVAEGIQSSSAPTTLHCLAKDQGVLTDYDSCVERKEITEAKSMPTRYYYLKSQISPGEWWLLGELVAFSPFISQKQTNKLLASMGNLGGQTMVRQDSNYHFKRPHDSLFQVIHTVHQALAEQRKLLIHYGSYVLEETGNGTLQPVLRLRTKNGIMAVEPRTTLWANGNYYLVVKHPEYPKYEKMHLRLDRIMDASLTHEHFDAVPNTAAELRDRSPSMYGGPLELVRFRCPQTMLQAVMDVFGTLPQYRDLGQYMEVSVQATLAGVKLFVLQNLEQVELIEPASLRNELKEILVNAMEKYENP